MLVYARTLTNLAVFLAVLFLFTGCNSPWPRHFGGDNLFHSGNMVSVPWSAPGPYHVLFISPDMDLWVYEDSMVWWLDDRLALEEQPLRKVLEDVVFVDWTWSGIVARTADNGLWQLDVFQGFRARRLMDNVKSVVVGNSNILAVKTDNTLWDASSQLLIMDNVAQVSAGLSHFLVLTNEGNLWMLENEQPVWVMDNIAHAFAGFNYSMAIDNYGTLWGWGRNNYGQLGDGTVENIYSPVKIMEGVVWIEPARHSVFAIKSDGSLWTWGMPTGSLLPVMLFDGSTEITGIRYSPFVANYWDILGPYRIYGLAHYFHPTLVNGINITKADGSLWVITPRYISQYPEPEWVYSLPPIKKMENVLFAVGGHAVKTDGSLWDIHREIIILPPGSVWTGEAEADSYYKVILSFEYDWIYHFSGGFGVVRRGDEQKIVDTSGYAATQFDHFDQVGAFSEGRAPAQKNGKWGFIDVNGNVVIPFEWDKVNPFDLIGPFSEGLAAVNVIENNNVLQPNHIGFINTDGEVVIPPAFANVGRFRNGLAPAADWRGFWGVIDALGNVVVPFNYSWVSAFDEGGLFRVLDWHRGGFDERDRWGVVDRNGNVVVEPIYLDIVEYIPCQDTIGIVTVSNWIHMGAYDIDGNMAIPLQYAHIFSIGDGLLGVVRDGRYGVLDVRGNVVVPFGGETYERFVSFRDNNYIAVMRDGKWGAIDSRGNVAVPLEHEFEDVLFFSADFIVVSKNGKWGAVNISGDLLLPIIYDHVSYESSGLAVVVRDGKSGLAAVASGNIVTPLAFDDIRYIGEGLFGALRDDGWGIIRIHD